MEFELPNGVSPGCVATTVGGSLPSFGGGPNILPYAKLHSDHFRRLCAVLDAARTGNDLLIRLAVEHQDRFGIKPSDMSNEASVG